MTVSSKRGLLVFGWVGLIPLALVGCTNECGPGYQEGNLGVCYPVPPGSETGLSDSGETNNNGNNSGGNLDEDCVNPSNLKGTVGTNSVDFTTLAWGTPGPSLVVYGFEEGHGCEQAEALDDAGGHVLMINLDARGEELEEGTIYDVFSLSGGNPGDPGAIVTVTSPATEGTDSAEFEASEGSLKLTSMEDGGVLVIEEITFIFGEDGDLSGSFSACPCDDHIDDGAGGGDGGKGEKG